MKFIDAYSLIIIDQSAPLSSASKTHSPQKNASTNFRIFEAIRSVRIIITIVHAEWCEFNPNNVQSACRCRFPFPYKSKNIAQAPEIINPLTYAPSLLSQVDVLNHLLQPASQVNNQSPASRGASNQQSAEIVVTRAKRFTARIQQRGTKPQQRSIKPQQQQPSMCNSSSSAAAG